MKDLRFRSGQDYSGLVQRLSFTPAVWLAMAGLFIMLCPGVVPALRAQAVYGSLIGTVTDTTGAAIPDATVTVTDVDKNTSVTVKSNGSGAYSVQHLITDIYRLTVEAPGFAKTTRTGIQVFVDTTPKVDVQLAAGSESTTVTVSGSAALLQTERADVSTILNERAVETLPNLNRNFTAFELLTPGTGYIGWNVGESNNPQRSQQIEVNGQLPFATGYELDGTDNQDPIIGIAVINPNLDAVSELKVTSQNYDAEEGKAVAGLVTAQTRSGSNAFHGSAFEYRRSDAQQARDPFTESVPNALTGRLIPSNLHNQFGGSIGGPVRQNRLFFFGDYQGLREKTGSASVTTVPTATAHTTCTSGGNCDLSAYPYQIYDPASNPGSPIGRTPFAGNIIPAGRLSGPAVALLKEIPLPNAGSPTSTTNNYTAAGTGVFNTNQFDVRLDDHTSEKLRLFGRFTRFGSNLAGAPYFGAAGGPGFANGFAGSDSATDYSVAAGGDYTLSAKWLTDFRFGWYQIHLNQEGPDFNKASGNQLGIPNTNAGDLSLNGGLPQFNIQVPSNGSNSSSVISYGTTANQFLQDENQYQIVNNWTHALGNHTIRFGVDARYALNHIIAVQNNNLRSGQYGFNSATTSGGPDQNSLSPGVGLATFLLGDISNFSRSQTFSTGAAERQKRLFLYAQDQWRVTPKLTLNYGLRWEQYFPETVNGKGQGGLLDLQSGTVRIAGYGPWGTNLNVAKSYTTFAPRLGVAWSATDQTVVRAGYGRVYGQGWSGNTFGLVLTASYPIQYVQQLSGQNATPIGFTLDQGPPAAAAPVIPADGSFVLPDGIQESTRPLSVRLPTVDAWNVAIQQQLTSTMSLQIQYVGSHAFHNMFDSSNQADPNQPTIAGFNNCNVTGSGPIVFGAGCTPQSINPLTNLPYTTNDRRPYFNGSAQQLGVSYGVPHGWTQGFRYNANQATERYNALEVVLQKRFGNGLQFLSHYTWAKALDNESDYFFIDRNADFGNSYYVRRNAFVFAPNYDLPFGRDRLFASHVSGWLNQVIGGFSLNGALTYSSGLPYTPTYASCGQDQDVDTGGSLCRPSKTGLIVPGKGGALDPVAHRVKFFTASPTLLKNGQSFGPYQRPAFGTFGNYGRDSLFGPNYFNTDLSVVKSFPVREGVSFQLWAQAFNVFNHVNLGGPDNCVDCQDGNAGYIFGIVASQDGTSMRRMQFAARVQF